MKYRAGVIGRTGRGDYGHGLDRVYLYMDEIEIVAIADENTQGLAEAGKRLGVSKLYSDYREMLEKEDLNIVSVCPRWVKPHCEMVLAVAEAGACVFLEKPMCQTLAEADTMISACEKAGITMGIAHQGRMHTASHYAKQLLQDGVIGTVLSAQMRCKEDRRGGGEDLMVLGTHMFDTLRFLLDADPEWGFSHISMADGRPVTKSDSVEGPEELGLIAGDYIHALYGFTNGVTATLESRRNQQDSGKRFGLQIWGTEGIMGVYEGSQQIEIYQSPFWRPGKEVPIRDITAESISAATHIDQMAVVDNLQMAANIAIVRDILSAHREGRQPISSGYDGRWAMEMIHCVYASHLSGQRIPLPLNERGHPLA